MPIKPPSPVDPKQQILYQAFIAFGQGTGGLRVHRETCVVLHRYCLGILERKTNEKLFAGGPGSWEDPAYGPQALERVRTMGRLAALLAIQAGSSDIGPNHFADAVRQVEKNLETTNCTLCWPPPSPPAAKGAAAGGLGSKRRRASRSR
jgi:hypothetical protein